MRTQPAFVSKALALLRFRPSFHGSQLLKQKILRVSLSRKLAPLQDVAELLEGTQLEAVNPLLQHRRQTLLVSAHIVQLIREENCLLSWSLASQHRNKNKPPIQKGCRCRAAVGVQPVSHGLQLGRDRTTAEWISLAESGRGANEGVGGQCTTGSA